MVAQNVFHGEYGGKPARQIGTRFLSTRFGDRNRCPGTISSAESTSLPSPEEAGRAGQRVAFLVHRAALHRDIAPRVGERRLQALAAVDDEELRRRRTAGR